jgi:hypothetical protein
MKALFGEGGAVPMGRAVAEHRRWLLPLAVILAINIGLLILVVLPLRVSVQNGTTRAQNSTAELAAAKAEFAAAEATRTGQIQATRDLERFYSEVLPADFAAAQRITHSKLPLMARAQDVQFRQGSAQPQSERDSALERLNVSFALVGEWDDVQLYIHAIETLPEFVVIDNVTLAEAGEGNAPLSLSLQVSTFYRTRRDVR